MELENYSLLGELIKMDYPTYSGLVLENYFRQKMAESGEYRNIGSWWQAKKGKEACEIDIVGIKADNKTAVIAEVKRQRKNFKPDEFAKKVDLIKTKVLANYTIDAICLTMEDM